MKSFNSLQLLCSSLVLKAKHILILFRMIQSLSKHSKVLHQVNLWILQKKFGARWSKWCPKIWYHSSAMAKNVPCHFLCMKRQIRYFSIHEFMKAFMVYVKTKMLKSVNSTICIHQIARSSTHLALQDTDKQTKIDRNAKRNLKLLGRNRTGVGAEFQLLILW